MIFCANCVPPEAERVPMLRYLTPLGRERVPSVHRRSIRGGSSLMFPEDEDSKKWHCESEEHE
jgi:hypothetical protein